MKQYNKHSYPLTTLIKKRFFPLEMKALTEEQINEELKKLPDWEYVDGVLHTVFEFTDFVEAMGFMQILAEIAEEHQHHPRITIEFNLVEVILVTHDVGAVTEKDIDFAHAVEQTQELDHQEDHFS